MVSQELSFTLMGIFLQLILKILHGISKSIIHLFAIGDFIITYQFNLRFFSHSIQIFSKLFRLLCKIFAINETKFYCNIIVNSAFFVHQ